MGEPNMNDLCIGEDLSGKERLTAQQKQRADWATAQKEERNRAEQLLRYSDYLYEVKIQSII